MVSAVSVVWSSALSVIAKPWRYTTKQPGKDWLLPDFDANAWKLGRGGFGKKEGSTQYIGTPWNTSDIWLRQEFKCKDTAFQLALLVIHHDDVAEVYLNGKPIWNAKGWNDRSLWTNALMQARISSSSRQQSSLKLLWCFIFMGSIAFIFGFSFCFSVSHFAYGFEGLGGAKLQFAAFLFIHGLQ